MERSGSFSCYSTSSCAGHDLASRCSARRSRRSGRRSCSGTGNSRNLCERRIVDRIPRFAPSIEPALQRPNLLDALLPQQNRQLRTGRFIRASAIQNDLPVARQLFVFRAQFLRVHSKRARNRLGIGFEIERMPQVDDHHVFLLVHFCFQLFHGDARNAQLANESLPRKVFVRQCSRRTPRSAMTSSHPPSTAT